MNRLALISAAAVLACGGLAMAQDKPMGDTPSGKDVSPAARKDAGKLEFGDPAPALQVEKWIKGEPVTGFEKGKTYIVEFWATWCGPCKASMPHLTELQKEYKDKGLTIIGVASPAWKDKLEDVEKMVTDKGGTMGYTVCWDKEVPQEAKSKTQQGYTNEAYMKAAKQRGIPTSFVIDSKGNVAWYGHPMELDYVLDDIVAGKWDYKTGPEKLRSMMDERDEILQSAQDDPKEALKQLNEFEKKYPKMAKELPRVKFALAMKAGMWDEAAKSGDAVVDQLIAAKDAQSLNEVAWAIVDPEGQIKGAHLLDLAMKAATKAVDLTEEKDGAILDTLARCYYDKGNKTRAIELQKKAIASVGKDQDEMKDQLEQTLKDYQGGSN